MQLQERARSWQPELPVLALLLLAWLLLQALPLAWLPVPLP
jgi:hypothetical protein